MLRSVKTNNRFKEITVERINVVESDGRPRLVISNKERSPEVLAYGKRYSPPIPGHNRPGLIFYMMKALKMAGWYLWAIPIRAVNI